jgi:hypothetical protein
MTTNDIKKIIEETLKRMNCNSILVEEVQPNFITAKFNSEELTSFKEEFVGWLASGIKLNTSGDQKYLIEFSKV